MSLTKPSFKWSQANAKAERLLAELEPFCEKIQIVGSIRRRRTFVGDIEILALPKFEADPFSLFGDDLINLLHGATDGLLKTFQISHDLDNKKWGPRYRRFMFDGIPVDLFICLPPAHYGVLEFIRTGPVDFTKPCITRKEHGGFLPAGFFVEDGQLFSCPGAAVRCDTEQDFFAAIYKPYVEPEFRK